MPVFTLYVLTLLESNIYISSTTASLKEPGGCIMCEPADEIIDTAKSLSRSKAIIVYFMNVYYSIIIRAYCDSFFD